MLEYDMLVLGSGAGANVASMAYQRGLTVAVVDNDRFGGTCLIRGCIPTKILTHVADLVMEIRNSENVNLRAQVNGVDFGGLMSRMRAETWGDSEKIEKIIAGAEGYDFFRGTGRFVADYTMEVNDETIKADRIILASGARPLIPIVKGLDGVHYLTNKTVLELRDIPESMIIVGGGYIAAEFAHFFSAVGTTVTVIGRNPQLLKEEDRDVSDLLQQELSRRMKVLTNHEVVAASETNDIKKVVARNRGTGADIEYEADELLIAAGRISNADLFRPEKTNVKTDEHGWIVVDKNFRTSKKNIWAFGDALGQHMFRHVANDQSQIVAYNLFASEEAEKVHKKPELLEMSYHAVPRAVFSWPQVATVGMTLTEATSSGRPLLVGRADYSDVAKGMAMGRPRGFARVIVDAEKGSILGATIIGPHAPTLIQEIVNLMYTPGRSYVPLIQAMHIHPALPEVVQRAIGSLESIGDSHHHHDHRGHTHEQ